MPKLHHVEKARKKIYRRGVVVQTDTTKSGERLDRSQPHPEGDELLVDVGESYFHWTFRFGSKNISKTKPKRQQLTQSAYYQAVWDIEDDLQDFSGVESADDAAEKRDAIRDAISELRDETESSLDNMPDSLQESETGELLRERIESLENAETELDAIDCDFDDEGDETLEEWLENLQEEFSNICFE